MKRAVLVILIATIMGGESRCQEPNTPQAAVADLRTRLRDPESLVVERAWVVPSKWGGYLCVAYRAKNGFGGYDRDLALYVHKGGRKANETTPFKYEGGSDFLPNNRMCSKTGTDVTAAVRGAAVVK